MTRTLLRGGAFSLTAPTILLALALGSSAAIGQTNHTGNPLRLPPTWTGGTLIAAPTNQTLWPGFSTEVLAINGSVPSPTIRVQRGSNFTARVENRLDTNLVIHWHGIIAPASMDGHPRDAVPPGQTYTVAFPIRQRAGTYFYHPHPELITGELVYRGLAGAFIVEDPAEAALGLPSGDHDVPLLIQDKRLREDRQLVYDPSMMEVAMSGFLGDVALVNATPEAYLSVDRSRYRLRLINGSNARVYKLGFSDERLFQLIATDGGLLATPATVASAFLAPGERIEIVVDFSTNQLGDFVLLRSQEFDPMAMNGMSNTNAMDEMDATEDMDAMMDSMMGTNVVTIYTNGMNAAGCNAMMTIMMAMGLPTVMAMTAANTTDTMPADNSTMGESDTNHMGMMNPPETMDGMDDTNTSMVVTQGMAMDVLRFYVDREATVSNTVPARLADLTAYDPARAARTRTFTLDMLEMAHGINGASYDINRTDFQVPFGELEIWKFINNTDELHPMHPHGASFQVLDRMGDTNLPPENLGWKDTVLVWPNETVRVLVRFQDYPGDFVAHCHNLEHEDSGMMQNFTVQPTSLRIASQPGGLVFSYPAAATNWALEAAEWLGAGAQWTNAFGTLSVTGDWATLSIPMPPGNRFYRLRQSNQNSGSGTAATRTPDTIRESERLTYDGQPPHLPSLLHSFRCRAGLGRRQAGIGAGSLGQSQRAHRALADRQFVCGLFDFITQSHLGPGRRASHG